MAPDAESTKHGSLRASERGFGVQDIDDAKEDPEQVDSRIGKYGTLQNIYKGRNGLVVVEETTGRNAGKLITAWWWR